MEKIKINDLPNQSLFQKGKKNPMYGKVDELSPSWKGDDAGYQAIHLWVRNNKPKVTHCEKCNCTKKLEISNISGKNKRDIKDYEWLCIPCHRNKDNKKGFIGKVTKKIMGEIRSKYKKGNVFQRDLADQYGLNQSTISRILNKKRSRYI